ncbi:MAG: ribulose-phosphate 3-epimerase [Candidatus Woesearchaeota archaeon]
MNKIIPTVFVEKGDNFDERFSLVTSLTEEIHIDIMDGSFVPKSSIGINSLPDLQDYPDHVFEVHLMVTNPGQYLENLSKMGFKRVIFHYESVGTDLDVKYLAALVRRHKMEPMVAISPDTPAESLFLIDTISKVLVMGVYPGKENQQFITNTYKKVSQLKERGFFVQVDGGVTPAVAKHLAKIGCDKANSGSFVSNASNPESALEELEDAWQEGLHES